MNQVTVEKNNNSAPTETQLKAAMTNAGGTPGEVTGTNASRTLEYTGTVNHNTFKSKLRDQVPNSRETSWNFVWADALQTRLATLVDKEQLQPHDLQSLLHTVLTATNKSVVIQIAPEDLAVLKQSQYKLCFAKKVGNNDYNVVWQSYGAFLANNKFTWTPQYQLFGANSFNAGITVDASTNVVTIGLGETAVLDSNGTLGAPSTGGPSTAFTLDNEFGDIHPGVNQLSTGIDGKAISTPIYVATNPVVTGLVELAPVEKVLVWFEQNVQTSTMFSTSRSKAIEIDLTSTDGATRLYSGGQWTTP